jgi:hypothetical protein
LAQDITAHRFTSFYRSHIASLPTMKSFFALNLVHRAKSSHKMKSAFALQLLKKAIRLLKEKQSRLVRRTGLRLLLATQKKVRWERKWKRIMTLEVDMRRTRGLPTLEEDARILAGLPIITAWPCDYRDARLYEPVTDAQREANRPGWNYDDRTRRGGVANPFPQTPNAEE